MSGRILHYFIIAMFISACGGTSVSNLNDAERLELIRHTGTAVSIQFDIFNTLTNLGELFDANKTVEIPCSDGGKTQYSFIEEQFPVTVTYDHCVVNRTDPNGFYRSSIKNGVLHIDGSETNATVAIVGDFSNVIRDSNNTSTNLLIEGNSTISMYQNKNLYNNSELVWFSNTNVAMKINEQSFHMINASYGIVSTAITQESGEVEISSGKRLELAVFGNADVPYVAGINSSGDLTGGSLLYKQGKTLYIFYIDDVNLIDQEYVAKYLWN